MRTKQFNINWLVLFYEKNDDGTVKPLYQRCLEEEPSDEAIERYKVDAFHDEQLVIDAYEVLKISRFTPAGEYWFKELGLPDFVDLDDRYGE